MEKEFGGALLGRGRHDWQAGANSPIIRKVLKEDGDWKDLGIPHEIQFVSAGSKPSYDTMMCVSYNGTTDAIEYIMMQQLKLNMIPYWKVKWLKDNGYFEDGFLNFSERFTAINGHTNSRGAYVYKVADGMRLEGLIPNKMFPMADNFYDNISRSFITKEMIELGLKFAELFKINYEWIRAEDTAEYMKYSPIAVTGVYGIMEGDTPIFPTGTTYHSMLQVNETEDYREIDDSYWQQFKKYKKKALRSFAAFYVDASENTMFDKETFIAEHDQYIIRNVHTGAYGVIYNKTPMLITNERAGLFMVDRDARGLVGVNKRESLTDQEWLALGVENEF